MGLLLVKSLQTFFKTLTLAENFAENQRIFGLGMLILSGAPTCFDTEFFL